MNPRCLFELRLAAAINLGAWQVSAWLSEMPRGYRYLRCSPAYLARHSEEPTATKNLDPSLCAQDDNRAVICISRSCIPSLPSLLINSRAGVVEWQTRRTQNPVGVTLWGFKSPLRHHLILRARLTKPTGKNFLIPLSIRAIKRQSNNKLAQLATYTSAGQRRDRADVNLILLKTTYPHRSAGN